MKLLVTGGAGFIGSNFIRYILATEASWQLTNVDKLTYAGNLDNLEGLDQDRHYRFVRGDIADARLMNELFREGFDAVVNFAAESHVDRSIADPSPFVRTNVLGVQVLLDAARRHGVKKFVQMSTDEVYGSLGPEGKFVEESPLAPSSPYSATKAAADLLCLAYYKTYGTPVLIVRCCNNFGPYQFPEKLIPLCITNALEDKPLPVYGDGLNIRDWIYVEDCCDALRVALIQGRIGEVYNVGASSERTNLDVIHTVLSYLDKSESLIAFVADRPGHDRRYALDMTKFCRETGWGPACGFEGGIKRTVEWYKQRKDWWRNIRMRGHESCGPTTV